MKLLLITSWITALLALPQSSPGCDTGKCSADESKFSGYPPRRQEITQTPPIESAAGCETNGTCDDLNGSGPAPYPAKGVQEMENQFDGYQQTNDLESRQEPQMNIDLTEERKDDAGIGEKDTQIHRHIYFHAAPEEQETEQHQLMMRAATRRKHYTILFIDASRLSRPARPQPQAAVPQNEVKTIVYVLVKKADDLNQADSPTASAAPPSRPEVYFIKYKEQRNTKPITPDEAGEKRHEGDKAPYPAKKDSGLKYRRHTYFS